MRFLLFLMALASLAMAEPSYLSFPSDISWKSMQSAHFNIIYREGQKEFATRTLRAAERAHGILSPVFPETPAITSIVLADFSDSLNGYSLNFPYPHFVIFAAPPSSTGELSSLDHWLESVVLHEYVHTLHLYPATGLWKWLRTIFGTVIVPNGMMPAHLHEGLATLLETQFSKGGRGRSPFFKMLTRKAVEKKLWGDEFLPLDLLDGSYSHWPHGTSPYYFGYYFYEHLWNKKGSKGIRDLTLSASSNWPYFVNSPFEDLYGLDISGLWREIAEEQNHQHSAALNKIKGEPLSELSYLTQTKFIKKGLALSESNRRVAFLSSRPDKNSQLEIIEVPSGKSLKETSIRFSDAGGLCWKETPQEDQFIFSTPHHEDFYSINRLALYNPEKNETHDLRSTTGFLEHVHEFACSKDLKSLLVYQETGGFGRLSLFSGDPWSLKSELSSKYQWPLPKDSWISSVSAGNELLFLLRQGNKTSLYEWNPPAAPKPLAEIEGHAFNLRQFKNQTYLIAAISGRDEVWRFEPKSRKLIKTVAVTGGINHFIPLESRFLVSSYEHGGFDLATAAPISETVEFSLSEVSSASPSENPESNWEEEDYSPAAYLVPRTWIPSALIVPYGFQAGAWIPMFDLSQKHFYDLNLGVDQRNTNDGTQMLPYLSGLYTYRFGKTSSLQSSAYFMPGFLVISRNFFKRWGTSLTYASQLPHLPIEGRVSTLFKKIEPSELGPANQSIGLGLELRWNNQATNGTSVELGVSHQQFFKSLGSQDDYFSSVASLETSLESPLWNSAQWYLSLRQGYTEGTPLYNSFFEGGGELLFSQGRGFFLNRGYLQGSFAARRIFGGNLEFRFPISRIDRGIGLSPAFLQNLSGALVLDTTSFDRGLASSYHKVWMKEFLWSTGVELKSQWKLFYYLPTQVRLGAYRGLSVGGEPFYFTMGVEATL